MYNKQPSEIMHIENDYEAYCFDEAVTELRVRLETSKKQPRFKDRDKSCNPGLDFLMNAKTRR